MEDRGFVNRHDGVIWLLFCVGSFLFIALNYAYWYRFMEQYMMFQTTTDYFYARWTEPGGLGEYVAEFLTLTFSRTGGAALVIALLLGGITGCFFLFLRACGTGASMWLAVLPAFLFWWYPQESIVPLLVLLISLALVWVYASIRKDVVRYTVGWMELTLAYFFFAPANLLLALWIFIYECLTRKGHTWKIVAAVAVAWASLLPLVAMRTCYVLPMREAFLSKYLSHPEYPIPASLGWILFAYLLVALLAYLFRDRLFIQKKKWRLSLIYLCLLCVMGYALFYRKNLMEQAYRYDYYARQGKWQEIVDHARAHPVRDADALIYLNLALSHTGRFTTELMRSRQIGVDGFIPHDPKSRLGLIEACEVAWQVGQVNAAQRFAFVGVLSAQRCVQSRLMKRLVETFLVLGEYRAAEKYIKVLESNPNYRGWAEAQRPLLKAEVCDSVDWVKAKRAVLPLTDNSYDLTSMFPNALAFLIDDHADNRPAFEYGMGYLLLYKDLMTFMHYMELMRERGEAFPLLYQEAICLFFSTVAKDPERFRSFPVSETVLNRFTRFAQMAGSMPPAVLKEQFGDTYYYYAQFIQAPKK